MKKHLLATALFAALIPTATSAAPDAGRSNKATVQAFFEALSVADQDGAFALVDDAASWWVPGTLPFSGTKTKAEYRQIARSIEASFPGGFTLTVLSMIEEDGTVAAEVESQGVHVNGRTYNNKYHFLIRLVDGRFTAVKEYMDTQHLAALIAP